MRFPIEAATQAALCALTAVVMLQGCGHRRALDPAQKSAQEPAKARTQGASVGLAAGKVLAMGPSGLVLPVFLGRINDDQRRFSVAASRALRMVYEEDSDDASQLLALVARLNGPESSPAADDPTRGQQHSTWLAAWEPILQEGIQRALTLQEYAPGVRALKQAYAEVFIEDGTGVLRKLSMPQCHVAQQALQPLNETSPDFTLTVEPMGPRRLHTLLEPCNS